MAEVNFTITEDNYTTNPVVTCEVGDTLNILSSYDSTSKEAFGLSNESAVLQGCTYVHDFTDTAVYSMKGVVTTTGTYNFTVLYHYVDSMLGYKNAASVLTIVVNEASSPATQPSNTFLCKVDGQWKGIKSLFCKVNGSWKSVSELFAKKDGVWVEVFPGGVKIVFHNYAYPIPVASGWEYSNYGSTWTTVTSDGEINTSGTFTGTVKVKGILTLDEWFSKEDIDGLGEGLRIDGTPLSVARQCLTAFTLGDKGYVCGGDVFNQSYAIYNTVDVYDTSGNRTTGTSLSVARNELTSFVNGSKGYVCGGSDGGYSSSTRYSTVDVYDVSGNRTTGTSLSVARDCPKNSFVNGSKGYVCGGYGASLTGYSTVDVYDVSGNRTTGTSLSNGGIGGVIFVNNSKGYVCGTAMTTTVDVYDVNGNKTTGTSLSQARYHGSGFTNNSKGYVCGGNGGSSYGALSVVDVYDTSGSRTTGTSLSSSRAYMTSFVYNSKGFVCGGNYVRITSV